MSADVKLSTRQRRAARIAQAMPVVAELSSHTDAVDSDRMTRRYRGGRSDDQASLLLTTPFSRNGRGDEPLAESNYRVISADLERVAAFGVDYRIDAWVGGTIHTLQVRADDALALRAVERWISALSDYPIADESDFSEEEWNQNHPSDTECYVDSDDECPCGNGNPIAAEWIANHTHASDVQ